VEEYRARGVGAQSVGTRSRGWIAGDGGSRDGDRGLRWSTSMSSCSTFRAKATVYAAPVEVLASQRAAALQDRCLPTFKKADQIVLDLADFVRHGFVAGVRAAKLNNPRGTDWS